MTPDHPTGAGGEEQPDLYQQFSVRYAYLMHGDSEFAANLLALLAAARRAGAEEMRGRLVNALNERASLLQEGPSRLDLDERVRLEERAQWHRALARWVAALPLEPSEETP